MFRGRETCILGDSSQPADLARASERATELEPLGGWVNNAALAISGNLHEPIPDEVAKVFDVNLMGYYWGCAQAVQTFVAQSPAVPSSISRRSMRERVQWLGSLRHGQGWSERADAVHGGGVRAHRDPCQRDRARRDPDSLDEAGRRCRRRPREGRVRHGRLASAGSRRGAREVASVAAFALDRVLVPVG